MTAKSTMARVGAVMAGGLMLCMASAAHATFTDMTYNCTFSGPVTATSCGTTVKPDSISFPLDGHIGMWETYTAPGMASVTINLAGTYTGEATGERVYYSLGFDKDFLNLTGAAFYGFDMVFWGPPEWEPMLIMELPYVDTAGYFTATMANTGGIWFDGMLINGMTSKMWAAVMVPLHLNGGEVNGSFMIYQIPKVPEPATLALFGLGLAGLGVARRRRKTG